MSRGPPGMTPTPPPGPSNPLPGSSSASPTDYTFFAPSPSPGVGSAGSAPSPSFRGFGVPGTPLVQPSRGSASPRGLSTSPRKTNAAASTSGSGLQSQINALRAELTKKINDLATSFGSRLETLELDLGNLRDPQDGQIAVLEGKVSTLGKNFSKVVNELKGLVEGLSEKIDNDLSPTKDTGVGCTPVQYTAAQGVVRSIVRFLYACDQPYPDYPADPNQPWPTMPSMDGVTPGHPALRFDFGSACSSSINTHAISAILDYIERNRGQWPSDPAQTAVATQVPSIAFRKAVVAHFEYLRDSRNRRVKHEMLDMTASMFPVDSQGASSLAGSSLPIGSTSELAAPTAQARRSKKKTLAQAVKLRRPLVPQFSGPEYAIMDQLHSQCFEYVEGGKRVWANETWMSSANREVLTAIFAADITSPDKSVAAKLSTTARGKQPIGALVIDNPTFPQSHSADPSMRLQQWQFDDAWYAQHETTSYWNIVPVATPTSFSDVSKLTWALTHPNRPMPPPTSTVSGVGEKRRREDDAAVDLSDDSDLDGLDGFSRAVSRSRSRSVSPEKRSGLPGSLPGTSGNQRWEAEVQSIMGMRPSGSGAASGSGSQPGRSGLQ